MLLGEYDHTLDDKNRLTLPAKFREEFADGGVVTRGHRRLPGRLHARGWDASSGFGSRRSTRSARKGAGFQRYFFSGATEAEPDKQGRGAMPAPLSSTPKLGREVVVAGVDDHARDLGPRRLAQAAREVEGSAEHVAERLAANRD